MHTYATRWATAGAAAGLAGVTAMATVPMADDQLTTIAAGPGRFLVGTALTFVAAALIGTGFLLIGRRCAGHGHRVTAGLVWTAAAGWLVHTALIAHNAVSYELALLPDRAAATELEGRIYGGPVFLGILLPMLALSVIGTTGAGLALWRAGHAPLWAAGCLVLAIVSDFVAPERLSGVPMFALLLLGFVGLGMHRERASQAEVASGLRTSVGTA